VDRGALASFWAAFVRANPSARETIPETVAFGDSAELQSALARLVVTGRKRATTSLLQAYGGDPLPARGTLFIVIDGEGVPHCVCRITSVEIKAFSEVDERDARDEGEGDCTLRHWTDAHRAFFKREAERGGDFFDEESAVVFERFEVIWKNG